FHSSGKTGEAGYNAFEEKNKRLFTPFREEENGEKKTRIGLPRVLNLFENYPFWNALLTGCGFEVVLSPESTFSLYQKGVSTIMSDNICFPAKLVHGHILSLIDQEVDRIFYPIVPKEEKEFDKSNNSFNCPVVSGYPDVVRSSIDPEGKYGLPFDSPVISFNTEKTLKKACFQYLSTLGVSRTVFNQAFPEALLHRERKIRELVDGQKSLFEQSIAQGKLTFVIAGRPYHTDPLVHQKTGQILADLGVQVFTDDVFRSEQEVGYGNLNVVSQWSYPNRVIQSALQVAKMPQHVQLIQLNSFGCGPDSFFMDEAASILKEAGKSLTVIRIDEIASPGSIRLRLRSLVESMRAKGKTNTLVSGVYRGYSSHYKKEDQGKTILIPWLCDFLSPFVPALGELAGYKIVNLPKTNYRSVDAGLKYGHNEVCYPSTLVLGDIINGLASGSYDLNNVVVAITQTGGQCRATNYIAQIKTGLSRAGYGHIPVIALTSGKTYQNDQKDFRIPWMKLVNIAVYTILYGDALFQMYNAIRPREKQKGETQRLFDFYMEQGSGAIRKNDHRIFLRLLSEAIADFNAVPVYEREFKKIGVIGEIFVKYNNYAQYHVSDWLRDKGVEVVSPPILDFIMQYFVNSAENYKNGLQRGSKLQEILKPLLWKYMNRRIERVEVLMRNFRYYQASESIYTKAEYASEILSLSNQFGEGWSVAGEVASFARQGIDHVVCIQPFGCIANHVVAKGIEKRLKKFYPSMNLLYLDVDGGVGEVNIQNRLHFMI
ncbi:acyl-CoA dehydratase activase-related protein, partial [Bacteroidales bacterium OttesenSCG-928-J19]|nr:acyl-CoA dehydratase activase-related protein [Bacteroidales bacterium OttesenSCG-928-J19]